MYYIFLDESDKKGEYYSNFYGGIVVPSQHLEEVKTRLVNQFTLAEIGNEEVKWQKVTEFTLPKYTLIVNELFSLLKEGKAKVRIFFRKNTCEAPVLTLEQKQHTYTILYYQLIKHAFGFKHAPKNSDNRISLFFDQMPITHYQRELFKSYLLRLNSLPDFVANGTRILPDQIFEIDSKKQPILQALDLVLGAMCFRLNKKHKLRDHETGKIGRRTKAKEKLYKYISTKIREIKPNFNIGISTGYTNVEEIWSSPYRHWSFIPSGSVPDPWHN